MTKKDYYKKNHSEKELPPTIGVKFCQDIFFSTSLMDQYNIPYTQEELEDTPSGKYLRIKKKQD